MPKKKDDFPTARPFLPEEHSLPLLKQAADDCKGCDLYENATQTVFGEGPPEARLMLVGEQPGDQEDRKGQPFVGPAGRILDQALEEAGIARDLVYVTNAVKHFKWTARGKRRIHDKPRQSEIQACKPWLQAEIEVVRPLCIVCLGATAAQALLGSKFRLTQHRGEPQQVAGYPVLATVHPSSLLRIPDSEARQSAFQEFVSDLRVAAALMRGKG
jgi:uracil-DNA glycosylase